MAHVQLVETIIEDIPSPILSKQWVNLYYASIRDTHCLLTANAASIESPRGGGHNGHLGLVLTATQYALVIQVLFFLPTNPGRTPTIPAWSSPFNYNTLIC